MYEYQADDLVVEPDCLHEFGAVCSTRRCDGRAEGGFAPLFAVDLIARDLATEGASPAFGAHARGGVGSAHPTRRRRHDGRIAARCTKAIHEQDSLEVSKSPWGEDSQIGRLNWVTKDSTAAILDHLDGSHVFDLNVEYFVGMPSWVAAGDPPYGIWMTRPRRRAPYTTTSPVWGARCTRRTRTAATQSACTRAAEHTSTPSIASAPRPLLEQLRTPTATSAV